MAVKRMGAIDALTREFAREHSERLWKQLVLSDDRWAGGAESTSPYGSPECQTTYLYVLAGWAAVVAFVFPLLFGFR